MPALEHGQYVRPREGHAVGGDTALVCPVEGGLFLAITDVLGHGEEAHQLATRVEDSLREAHSADIVAVMTRLHEQLRGTRGAAVGLGWLAAESGRLIYCGVGNTVVRKFGETEQRLVSRDGVLGQNMRRLREESLVLNPREMLLFYTDGVKTHFSLQDYPQLLSDDVATVARQVVHRFGKPHDDAACIAVRTIHD